MVGSSASKTRPVRPRRSPGWWRCRSASSRLAGANVSGWSSKPRSASACRTIQPAPAPQASAVRPVPTRDRRMVAGPSGVRAARHTWFPSKRMVGSAGPRCSAPRVNSGSSGKGRGRVLVASNGTLATTAPGLPKTALVAPARVSAAPTVVAADATPSDEASPLTKPTPTDQATPAPVPALPRLLPAPVPGDPTAAVARFYQAVAAHDFAGAAALWSAAMQEQYPPAEYIDRRFMATQQINLMAERVVATGGGVAVVYVDIVELGGGQTRHWVGTWQLVNSASGWLLNHPDLQVVA